MIMWYFQFLMLHLIAFISGFLTILTPCVLPMLPILLGASAEGQKNKIHSYVIIASLLVSIFAFTIILNVIFKGVFDAMWLNIIGGIIIGFYGLSLLFPKIWTKISTKLGLSKIWQTKQRDGFLWDILLGASLGPIFTSCTPTYLLILGLITSEADFVKWLIALAFFCLGFGAILLAISFFWRKITTKLQNISSENGIWKKILGIICIFLAIGIATGYTKTLETNLVNSGASWIFQDFEKNFLKQATNNISSDKKTMETKKDTTLDGTESIAYFAGWCFWCIEWIMDAQNGVKQAISGYIWWDKNYTYDEVSTGKTPAREAVKVYYDAEKISYEKLVDIFFHQIDPTDGDGQFADRGFQYTPAVYYQTEDEKNIVEKYIENLENLKKFDKKIAVKIEKFARFNEAEEYHQNYSEKNSSHYQRYKKWSGRADFIDKNWKNLEIDRFEKYDPEKLKNSKEKYNILFFSAEWCTSCQAIKKDLKAKWVPENIHIFDVDYDTATDLKKKYNVVTQTTFVLIDTDGNLIKRWIPALGIDDLEEQVATAPTASQSKTYTDEELRKMLTPLQYKVTQEGYTEPPFQNEYWDNKEAWIYVDVIDGTPLFSSTDKFDSGTGWPSFTKTIEENFIDENADYSHGMIRTELKSKWSHLWHVFEDGPADKWGKRYCINSAALKFIPKAELKEKWYEKYLKLFE